MPDQGTPQTVTPPVVAPRHTLLEDVQALLVGTLLVSLGVALLKHAHLFTGGTVGAAFLLHYTTGISFGLLFFVINVPFYALAIKKMGWAFTLKSFSAVFLLSAFSELLPLVLKLESVNPWYAAVMGGVLSGVGLLALFRHQASLGGINVLVIYLQDRYGLRAGVMQMGIDLVILLSSLAVIPLEGILMSLLGAAAMNFTLAINHRRDHYIAI